MAYIPTNIRQFASTHETSDEIALAIFEIAPEGEEERVWQDPSDSEVNTVMTRAWELAGADESALHWGNETHRRA